MIIQVNFGDIQHSTAAEAHVHESIERHLGHLTDRLTRVEVHLRDENSSSKSAPNDKRCMMEARPAKRKPLAIEHDGDDLYRVIDQAAAKLSRAVKRDLERADAK